MSTDVGGSAAGFEALLADAAVTQIVITAPDAALVDRGSGLALHDSSLGDPNAVADALWRLANTAFPPPAPDNPVVDVRLADGTRVSAAFPPASPTGVVAAIRRPVLLERTLTDLVPGGSRGRADAARERDRGPSQPAAHGRRGRAAAALGGARRGHPGRPAGGGDRRGAAARARRLDRSGARGRHGGPLARGRHAARRSPGGGRGDRPRARRAACWSPRAAGGDRRGAAGPLAGETLARLTALAAAGLGATPAAAAALVASAFDLVVQVVAVTDGSARIVEVAEPRVDGAAMAADSVLAYYGDGNRRDPGAGRLQGRGVSARLSAAFTVAGSPLPAALVAK